MAKRSAAFPNCARAGSEAWISLATPWEKPSASSMCNDTFLPKPKPKCRRWSTIWSKAFGKRIDSLTWMSPETKVKAKAKLATLKVGVGYPDQWQDYSGLEIVKGDALGNEQRAELSSTAVNSRNFTSRWTAANGG